MTAHVNHEHAHESHAAEAEEVVWWAFHPRDDAGVFVPYEPWALRSLNELPREEDVARLGVKRRRTVEMPGGEPGVVSGYLTPDADFYVAIPVDTAATFLFGDDRGDVVDDGAFDGHERTAQ
jgi:hypothetical protein